MINQTDPSVEISNDVGNSIPANLPPRTPLVGYYNSNAQYPGQTVLIQPIDVANATSLQINLTSISSGATISVQTSPDGGLTWNQIGVLSTTGISTVTTALYGSNLLRIVSTTSAVAGTTTMSVFALYATLVQAYLDNPAASVVPFTTSTTWPANSVLTGPYYIGSSRSGMLHITSTASGATVQVQLSNDGSNFYAASMITIAGTPQQATSLNSTGAYGFATNGALYARISTTTAITSGTLTFSVSFSSHAAFSPQNSAVNVTPIASSGVTNMVSIVTAASNNLTLLKASNACVTGIFGTGAASGKTCYLKMFNASSTGAVTMGTTVPLLNIGIAHPHSASFDCSLGLRFGTGLVVAITANAPLLDNTATSVGDGVWNLTWA
jgi:hypothetical protein